jgi:hypothetical protein
VKQFRGYVFIAAVILIIYAALALRLDREATQQQERDLTAAGSSDPIQRPKYRGSLRWVLARWNLAAAYNPQLLEKGGSDPPPS